MGDHKTIACFNAIPDAGGNNFYYANGTCCYTLASLYFKSTKDSSRVDTQDNRGSWEFLVSAGVRWITTDEPINMISYYVDKQVFMNTGYFY